MLTERRIPLALAAAAALLGATGCVIQDSGASASFTWYFDGQTCGEAGVSRVLVELESFDEGVVYSEIHDCGDGGVVVEELWPGPYLVYFEGRGGSPFVWVADAEIELHGGDNEFTVDLFPTGGR